MQIKGRNWMVALQMYPYYWEKEVRWDSHSDPSASAVFGYNPLDLIFLTGFFLPNWRWGKFHEQCNKEYRMGLS
jgi:hypothetical protein